MKRIYTGNWVEGRSELGHQYWYAEWIMPRIEDWLLDAVVYLYPSEKDARDGAVTGGTGFFVGVSAERHPDLVFLYVVSNAHVALGTDRNEPSPVVRVNTRDGGVDILPLRAEDWFRHPDGDNLAVCPLRLDKGQYRYGFVPRASFITARDIMQQTERPPRIGTGDEVFFLGRFAIHDGKQRNLPTARFGNIALLPSEPIPHPSGIRQQSFLVEARSLSGYSGSPVFSCTEGFGVLFSGSARQTGDPPLLGVDWGHLHDLKPVVGEGNKPLPDRWYVEQNSGLMGVIPAWKLAELLDSEDLMALREREEEQHQRLIEGVALDVATATEPDA